MNRQDDPELEELLSDPVNREVVSLLGAARPGAPKLDPSFRSLLRAQLMSEARQKLGRPQRLPRFFLSWRPVPALATVAASFLIVAAGVVIYENLRAQPSQVAVVGSTIEGKKDVAPAEPIKLEFRGPVDKNAVAQSVEIQPAAQYTSRWEGQTLFIIPLRPLAASTGYTVTVKSTPEGPPTAVRFVTVSTPPPPVVPPQFRAENLTFLGENRVADPGTFTNFAWAPDGQALLVTRPVSEKPSPSPTVTPAAGSSVQSTTARAAFPTEIWLVSLQGTPVRRVVPRGSDPSVSPGGERIAFWRFTNTGEISLMVSALEDDGSNATKIASLSTAPGQPPVWVGSERLAYADGGQLRIVDLQGQVEITRIRPGGAFTASPDGRLLAVQTADGTVVYDMTRKAATSLPDGAGRFAWSAAGDLGFAVPGSLGTDVWVLRHDATQPRVIATAPGDTASEFNWAPDGNSLLFSTRAPAGEGQGPAAAHALIVNADGKSGIKPLGNIRSEYSAVRWSPLGRDIAFTRRDETNRMALWTAGISLGQPSAADQAQVEAQAEVDKFMTFRMDGKRAQAEAELAPDALARYQSADSLLSPKDPAFSRFYKVGVQLVTPDKLLIGVRIVLADAQSKQETSFFEEHLTVVRHDDRFRIDAVEIGQTVRLGRGPSVLSVVEVRGTGDDTSKRQLQVRFDADLDPDTVSKENIYLRSSSGDRVSADFSFDPTTRQVTLTPRKLTTGKYQLVVSTEVTDIKGQPLSQDYLSPLVVE